MMRLKYALVLIVGFMLVRTSPLKAYEPCYMVCGPTVDCSQECEDYGTCGNYDDGDPPGSNGWCAGECGDDYCNSQVENEESCAEDCEESPTCEWGPWQEFETLGLRINSHSVWSQSLGWHTSWWAEVNRRRYRTNPCEQDPQYSCSQYSIGYWDDNPSESSFRYSMCPFASSCPAVDEGTMNYCP
jgi:hypothetical protein